MFYCRRTAICRCTRLEWCCIPHRTSNRRFNSSSFSSPRSRKRYCAHSALRRRKNNRQVSPSHPGQQDPEPPLRIGPASLHAEAAAMDQTGHALGGKLIAVFSVNTFARREAKDPLQALHPDLLLVPALQMHFNTRLRLVPERNVRERVQIELAAEFAIDAGQH